MEDKSIGVSTGDLFNTIREAIVVLDEKMYVLSANNSFYEMFREIPANTEGRSIYELGSGQFNIEELHYLLEEIIPKKTSYSNFELKHSFKSIGQKTMLLNARYIKNQENPPSVLVTFDDITEKCEAIQKFEESESKYQKFVEGLNSIIIGFDLKGEITFFNHFSEKIFGYSRHEMIGRSFIGTIIPCIDSQGTDNSYICQNIISNPEKFYSNVSEGLCKNGSTIRFSWSAKTFYDPQGNISEILIDGNDITEIAEIRNRIDVESSQLNALLESIPVGVIISDTNNRVRKVSNSLCKMLAISSDKVINTNENHFLEMLNLRFPDNRTIDINELFNRDKLIPENKNVNFEFLFKQDGKTRYLNTSLKPLQNSSGNMVGSIEVWQDITDLKEKENLLRAQELKYATIVDNTPEVIARFDRQLRHIFVNQYGARVYGVTKEQVIGKTNNDLGMPSNKVEFWKKNFEEVFNTGKQKTVNFDFDSPNFGHQYFSSIFVPEFDEKHQVVSILAITRDVTEGFEAERQLRDTLESIRDGFYVLDKDWKFVYLNSQAEYMFDLHRKEVIGKTLWEIFPSTRGTSLEREFRIAAGGEIREFQFNYEPWNRWFLLRCFPRTNGGVSAYFVDITERKQLEEQLRKERELLQAIIEGIPVMITLYDPHLQMIGINKAFEQITGWTEKETREHNLMELAYPDPEYRTMVSEYMASLKPGFKDFKVTGKNGQIIESSWANIKIPDGRQVGIGIDIRERLKAEREITIAAERFNRIISSNIIGSIIVDLDIGNFTFANDYFLSMIGYSRDELNSKHLSWRNITPPEYMHADNKAIEELRSKGSATPYEKEFIRKDGTRVWVLLADTVLPGTKENVFVFVLDITARKQALYEAQQKSAETEAILNSFPDGYIVYNCDGSIRSINDFARNMLGYSEELTGRAIKKRIGLLHPYDEDGNKFTFEQFPSIKALRGEMVRNVIMRITRANKDIWLSTSASPIQIENTITGAILQLSNITSLYSLQKQLADERNFVNAILETSGALILVIERYGRIIRFNRACEILTGYSASEVTDQSVFDKFIPDDEKEQVSNIAERLFSGEPVVEFENNWLTRTGEKRFIRWRNTSIKNESGYVSHVIATGIDITDRKKLEDQLNNRAEQLAAANNDLESFSYSVSHDLRNPLNIIGGFSEILIEDYADRLDEEGRDYLKRISESTRNAQILINDILNLSRVGRQEIKRENVDISSMVSSSLNELKNMEPHRKSEFMIQESVHAYADPRMVHVALENLLRNAWKFTSLKEISRIEFRTMQKDSKTVFVINDNGAGFDSKFAKTIFEPFKRVHSEKEFGGTGVGLSIVKRVIDRHGGTVWAEGEKGKGATFYFTLE